MWHFWSAFKSGCEKLDLQLFDACHNDHCVHRQVIKIRLGIQYLRLFSLLCLVFWIGTASMHIHAQPVGERVAKLEGQEINLVATQELQRHQIEDLQQEAAVAKGLTMGVGTLLALLQLAQLVLSKKQPAPPPRRNYEMSQTE